MADIKEFVINDRRKFTAEGEIRPDLPHPAPRPEETAAEPPRTETVKPAEGIEPAEYAKLIEPKGPRAAPSPVAEEDVLDEEELLAPTPEQGEQAKRAFDATVDRLDTVIRATNPGMERAPEITFERVIQSLYMQALLQLGGSAAPGQQPRVDILGARQTIDMLGILAEKTNGNRTEAETRLLDTALFELRMGFLEVTQTLSQQAAARQSGSGVPPVPGGPSIVR